MKMNKHASVGSRVGSAAAGVALIILWGGNLLSMLPGQPPGIYVPGHARNSNNKMAKQRERARRIGGEYDCGSKQG